MPPPARFASCSSRILRESEILYMALKNKQRGSSGSLFLFLLRELALWTLPAGAALALSYRSGPDQFLSLVLYAVPLFGAFLAMKVFLEPRWNRRSAFGERSSAPYRQGALLFPVLQFLWVLPLLPFTYPFWVVLGLLFVVFALSPVFPRPPRYPLLSVQTLVFLLFLLQLLYPLHPGRFYADSFVSSLAGETVRSCGGEWGAHCSMTTLLPWSYLAVLLLFFLFRPLQNLMPALVVLLLFAINVLLVSSRPEQFLPLTALGVALLLVPGKPVLSNRLWLIYASLFSLVYIFLLVLAPEWSKVTQSSGNYLPGLFLATGIILAETLTGMVPYISGSGRPVRP